MKIADNLLIIISRDKLHAEWSDFPFDLNFSILWYGLYIPVRLKAFNIQYGSTTSVTIKYNGMEYTSKTTKYKYMGGHHGDYFPVIETSTHALRFIVSLNFVELKSIPKDSENISEEGDNAFTIFYQS